MTDRGTPNENAFGHLALARQLAAKSRDVATFNPSLARELADESRALLAFVEESRASDEAAETDVVIFDEFDEADGSGPSFTRFLEKQQQMIPVPGGTPWQGDEDREIEADPEHHPQGFRSRVASLFRSVFAPSIERDPNHTGRRTRPATRTPSCQA